MADKKTSLILIDKNRLWIFSAMTGEVLNLDLPTTVMKDMEVLNHELFIKQFESFISVHNLTGSRVVIVMAESLLFNKDFSGIEELKRQEAIDIFVANVPFDSIAQTTVRQDKKVTVIVANRDLIVLIKNSLEKHKCDSTLALPATVFSNLNVAAGLNQQLAQTMISQAEELKAYNLMEPAFVPNSSHSITTDAVSDKSHPQRLPLLLGTFGGLISLLIGVAVVTNSQSTVPPSRASAVSKTPKIAPTAVSNIQSLRLDLIRNDQKASVSSQLKAIFQSNGVTDVRELLDSDGALGSSQIIFSNAVTVSVQGQIINIVKTIEPGFSTKIVTGLARDVEIRLK